jgi:hypothetical protein
MMGTAVTTAHDACIPAKFAVILGLPYSYSKELATHMACFGLTTSMTTSGGDLNEDKGATNVPIVEPNGRWGISAMILAAACSLDAKPCM